MEDRPGRLFLCARCRQQVLLCSRCDRGNRYCGAACRSQARASARREAAQRYQCSWRGRLAHAARSRRWRERRAGATHNVTHQGSLVKGGGAPLAPCHADMPTDATRLPAAGANVANEHANERTACGHCARALPPFVRLGFLRHAVQAATPAVWWRRHDHRP